MFANYNQRVAPKYAILGRKTELRSSKALQYSRINSYVLVLVSLCASENKRTLKNKEVTGKINGIYFLWKNLCRNRTIYACQIVRSLTGTITKPRSQALGKRTE